MIKIILNNIFLTQGLEKRHASLWVFSQAATDVDNRELSSCAQWKKRQWLPKHSCLVLGWTQLCQIIETQKIRHEKSELFMFKHGNRTSTPMPPWKAPGCHLSPRGCWAPTMGSKAVMWPTCQGQEGD